MLLGCCDIDMFVETFQRFIGIVERVASKQYHRKPIEFNSQTQSENSGRTTEVSSFKSRKQIKIFSRSMTLHRFSLVMVKVSTFDEKTTFWFYPEFSDREHLFYRKRFKVFCWNYPLRIVKKTSPRMTWKRKNV